MITIRFEGSSVTVPLLNYTTKIPAEQTAAEIMSILVKKGRHGHPHPLRPRRHGHRPEMAHGDSQRAHGLLTPHQC